MFRALSNFSNKIVKNAIYLSRGTLWQKHYVDSVKQFPTLGDKMFDLRRKICSTVVKSALFVSRWAIGRIDNFERNFTFSDFFRTSREHFLVLSLNLFRNGRQNCFFKPSWTYPLRKIFWQNIFFISGLGGNFSSTFIEIFEEWLSKLQFTCSDGHFEKGSVLWGNVF